MRLARFLDAVEPLLTDEIPDVTRIQALFETYIRDTVGWVGGPKPVPLTAHQHRVLDRVREALEPVPLEKVAAK